MPSGSIDASAAPASITSAAPARRMWSASPIACAPVAHAVDGAEHGPCSPARIDTWPAAMLTSILGTKCGETRRAPRSRSVSDAWTMSSSPPIPEPTATPVRCRCAALSGRQFAAASASSAAASAKRMNGERLPSSPGFASAQRSASNSSAPAPRGTAPPMSTGSPASFGSRTTPEPPASNRFQLAAAPAPSGETRPTPVTTTRCGDMEFRACGACGAERG